LIVSGLVEEVVTGIVFVDGSVISVSLRVSGSSSLSDFADSSGENAGSIWL
jgi:hypothetical protein